MAQKPRRTILFHAATRRLNRLTRGYYSIVQAATLNRSPTESHMNLTLRPKRSNSQTAKKIGISPAFRVEIFVLIDAACHSSHQPAILCRRRLHRYHLGFGGLRANVMHRQLMLFLCDISLRRTKFRAAYLVPIVWMASLVPVFEPALVCAEINIPGEEARPNGGRSAISAATSGGTWRLVRTANPRGGPDAVSVMQTADATRSDIDLVGLTLRCSDTGFDVLVVFLKPFPPRRHPKVKLTTAGATVHLEATVVSPGAAISLPAEAAMLVKRSGQSSSELAIEVEDDGNATRGIISFRSSGSGLRFHFSRRIAHRDKRAA